MTATKKMSHAAALVLACATLFTAAALDITLTPGGINLRTSGGVPGVYLNYPALTGDTQNRMAPEVEVKDDTQALLTYASGARAVLTVQDNGRIELRTTHLAGTEKGVSLRFQMPAQPAAGVFSFSTDAPGRKPVPAEKSGDGFIFRGDNKRFELVDGEKKGFVIMLPSGYQEFKDFRVWNNNPTFEWVSHSHLPTQGDTSTYVYTITDAEGKPPRIQKAKTDAPAAGRHTPYPPARDESQWPGKGPVRTFGWQEGIRKNHFNNRAHDENAIVFVGDATTENFRDVGGRFPHLKIANRGVGGDTSRCMLFRFPLDVLTLNPQLIVLLAGTNDLTVRGNPEHTLFNIGEMVRLARDYDAKMPFILCTIPMGSQPGSPINPTHRERINAGLRELAAKHPAVEICDLEKALQNPDGTQNLACYGKDRLHLGPQGYDKWAQAIAPFLANKPGKDSPANPAKIDLSQFKLVWADEFEGNELNRKFWDTPNQNRQGASRWRGHNITVADGICRFAIHATGDPVYRYESAGIRTAKGYNPEDALFSYKYGYAEVRCRLPRHVRSDYWAAFWLIAGDVVAGRNPDTRLGTEIDIFESFNQWDRGRMSHVLHWNGYGPQHNAGGLDSGEHRELLDGGFHTFGLYWDESNYIFYIDGIETARTNAIGLGSGKDGKVKSQGTCRHPAYIKLSVEAAPWCGPSHLWEKDMPEEDAFEVDYVRVYQKK